MPVDLTITGFTLSADDKKTLSEGTLSDDVLVQFVCTTESGHDPSEPPDDRVRPSHAAFHGRVFSLQDAPVPPLDYGCRCAIKYVAKPGTLAEKILPDVAPSAPTTPEAATKAWLDNKVPEWKKVEAVAVNNSAKDALSRATVKAKDLGIADPRAIAEMVVNVKNAPSTGPEPVKPEPVKPTPVKPESVKPTPVKPESVKPTPVKPESVKPYSERITVDEKTGVKKYTGSAKELQRDIAVTFDIQQVGIDPKMPENIRSNAAVAVIEGLERLRDRGYDISKLPAIRIAERGKRPDEKQPPNASHSKGLGLNAIVIWWDAPQWKENKKMSFAGWSATKNISSTVVHEFGHFLHEAKGWSGIFSGPVDSRKRASIKKKVSQYATFNKHEFVAEVFSGIMEGRTFPADMMALYKQYNGPTILP